MHKAILDKFSIINNRIQKIDDEYEEFKEDFNNGVEELSRILKRRGKKCLNCEKRPSFGLPGEIPIYCSAHKTPEMIDVKHKSCAYEGCNKEPYFNSPEESKGLYCIKHKFPGMIDVKHKKCIYEGCKKQPYYNFPDEKRGLYCNQHKKTDMVDIKNKKCAYEGCKTLPRFNILGETKPIYCGKHKKPDMINVRDKKCAHNGCDKMPSFNLPRENKPLYCKDHKTSEMIDVKNKKCVFEGCDKIPIYNLPDETKGLYCREHKTSEMINIKDKKCASDGCGRTPSFNLPGKTRGLYCLAHKEPNMVNIMHKKCQFPNCEKHVKCGPLWKPRIHCAEHKDKNDYFDNYPKCDGDLNDLTKCHEKPVYSDSNYPKRCENHKMKTDTNIVEKSCKNCGLTYYLNDIGLCNDCNDFIVHKVHKAKETDMKNFLESRKIKYLSHDKIPDGSCSKYRPDFIIDYEFFIVILEVDENQHKSYACECEIGRMIQLYQDFGGIPVIFIRYNPDNYKNSTGELIKSTTNRKNKIIRLLDEFKNYNEWKTPLSVVYLFYDGYDDVPKIENIDYEHHRTL